MIKTNLLVLFITIILTSCSYTKLLNKPYSDRIIGNWKKNIPGVYNPSGWGRSSITFRKNNSFSGIYSMKECSYGIKNDTLVVYSKEKLDSAFFRMKFKGNILLTLSPLNNEESRFDFLSGKWNWW